MKNDSFLWGQGDGRPDVLAVYQAVAAQMTDLLLVADQGGEIVWSEATTGVIPVIHSREELRKLIHPDDLASVQRSFYRLVANYGRIDGHTFRMQVQDGEYGWFEANGLPFRSDANDYVLILFRDVTERREQNEMLKRMAFHDSLTGLPNRRLLEERLGQAMVQAKRSGQPMAVLSIDVDDFKQINDEMGHEIGDLFLIAFAKRVKSCIREIDTFARIGGDEFTILLPTLDSPGSVEKVAARISEAVRLGWDIAGIRFSTTASVGIALFPADGSDAETLLRHVDSALYEVKSNGRDGYRFFTRES